MGLPTDVSQPAVCCLFAVSMWSGKVKFFLDVLI